MALVHQKEPARIPQAVKLIWAGKLAPQQISGSQQVSKAMKQKRNLLLWAVTGSGKTEMLFKGITAALKSGERVAIVDVCRELYPRLQAVFPEIDILLLYGSSEETYRYSLLTICTTHQLLRFYQAFDVLIIDEIDAFPFADNPQLAHGVAQSRLPKSSLIYLTATPSLKLLRQIKDDFMIEKIPARYHRRPLPVPKLLWWNKWRQRCASGKKLKKLTQLLKRLLSQNRVLLFCPSISLMEMLAEHLKKNFPELAIATVHGNHPRREEIVTEMRENKYQLLLTTTILERGVTFEKLSVIVLGANHRVFNQAALIQIAGRVDRKGPPSQGEVIFIYDEMTKAMRQALREINAMNQAGIKAGLVDEV
ncbi:helicase-related protein [Enterococcus sp. HY326]|uniref:helicase-related protein n=1 Tax=Enterococcus sp. HY326 TaxID=2971265 RepID=UPI00223FDFED|nr:helicase-related protein [Enterococcus sp. HY326]